ncbi:MAG: CCA tRNA nucleotidyltransferase [Victivallales bacterium]|nr:CCA tRNA nucleotidyltransferase [Victivallales bacterium]
MNNKIMKHELQLPRHVVELISELQNAGFESYIVGGAIRDLLLGRKPKDFDISTSATPEEVRAVFGRRSARIIGKRFRLVHVIWEGDLFEVSTFRQAPGRSNTNAKHDLPGNLILSDNSFGTAEEDAFRRDFTVNALFFDPVKNELIDFTGKGVEDINNRVVRAIGTPQVRFEEDPVRMLRALKLVGQYDFTIESATENALFANLALLQLSATSRLALELEKILSSAYGDKHLQAFHDYGLLPFFLPQLAAAWDTPYADYALNLLNERNCRVREGIYRNSVSLAMATLALPFVERECGCKVGELWQPGPDSTIAIRDVLKWLFKPQTMMNRMTLSAERMLILQPLFSDKKAKEKLINTKSYSHARELLLIRAAVAEDEIEELERLWPVAIPHRHNSPRQREKHDRPPRRRRRKYPTST